MVVVQLALGLFTLQSLIHSSLPQACTRNTWLRMNNVGSYGGSYTTWWDTSLEVCKQRCIDDPRCNSIDYGPSCWAHTTNESDARHRHVSKSASEGVVHHILMRCSDCVGNKWFHVNQAYAAAPPNVTLSDATSVTLSAATSLGQCQEACLNHASCRAVDYYTGSTGIKCYLRNAVTTELVFHTDVGHYIPRRCIGIDYCASASCQNNGTCIGHADGHRCSCLPGFSGTKCEQDIDECASTPCQHGRTCRDGINGYNCTCGSGYTGADCEKDIDECASNPCQHGGTCTNDIDAYTCTCTPSYTGTRCETDSTSSLTDTSNHTALIVGILAGLVGGLFLIAVVVAVILWKKKPELFQQRRRKRESPYEFDIREDDQRRQTQESPYEIDIQED